MVLGLDITLAQLGFVFVLGAAIVGPKDLPRAARFAGFGLGRAAGLLLKTRAQAEGIIREAQIPEVSSRPWQTHATESMARCRVRLCDDSARHLRVPDPSAMVS